jgi:predicted SprT family Zn-dependent metalloprotease
MDTLSTTERLIASFSPGDCVSFPCKGKSLKGTIQQTNAKRARVQCTEHTYAVPYALLELDGQLKEKRIRHIASVKRLAVERMTRNGLAGWAFGFDSAKRRAGCCNYGKKRISIAWDLARNASLKDVEDTVLHEIAHALVGPRHHHDEIWRKRAREIGCSGERTHRLDFSTPRWMVRCENSCWNRTAERRNPRLICRSCGGKLVYTPYTA